MAVISYPFYKETFMENAETSICTDTNLKPKSVRSKKQQAKYMEKECKVIQYNKYKQTLDILFGTYGIRLHDIDFSESETFTVKYKGEIGSPDFQIIR